jgi:hypothetical protein
VSWRWKFSWRNLRTQTREAAEALFEYLALRDAAPDHADIIIGFGHFDAKIPRMCGTLWRQGMAPRILFTGGIGAGTADLGQPEALYFREELRHCCPEIPESQVLVEPDSRHTGENVAYSIALLARVTPEACFGRGVTRAILVAATYRQRRVWLTCRHLLPAVHFVNLPPVTSFAQELDLFRGKSQDLLALMVGEVDRIVRYGEAGYIQATPIRDAVKAQARILREGDKHP